MSLEQVINTVLEAKAEELREKIRQRSADKEFARRNEILAQTIQRLEDELSVEAEQ